MISTTFEIRPENGAPIYILNVWSSTRNGFRHTSTVSTRSGELARASVSYLNRTWEAYEYQTSARRAVSAWIDRIRSELLSTWKSANGYKRMTQARAEEFKKLLNTWPEYQRAAEVLHALDKRPSTAWDYWGA